ncbi:hypothetical protein C0Q70_00373 [Pomacea canaliculata]|uniref:Uncharacterized protein n=1 Tax=Pomacea canaliculata TaxID=400727 RepID=A0A2T7PWH3_POMCA|nr:hypothetical protein C0Q70_00373 [Pomacea canaliculata]
MGEIKPLSCLVVAALLSTAVGTGLPPDVVTLRHSYVAAEDTPPGSVLFIFTASHHLTILQFVLEVHSMLLVTDVNDNPPKFDRSVYTADVNKNTSVGTIVFNDIHTTDPDTGTGGVVFYQMVPVGSDTHDIFVINSTSGSVILNQSLDFQTTNSFHYLVTATDGGGLRSHADLYFAILGVKNTLPSYTVLAQNSTTMDRPPVFRRIKCETMLPENGLSFYQPLRLEATHGDKPQSYYDRITYSLSSSSSPPGLAGHFHVDPFTGDLTVVQALDFDNIAFSGQPGVITLTVVAKDHGPVSLSSKLIAVHAQDGDGGAPNNHVFYFLETGGLDQFAIDHVTGIITVVGKLDHESVANYSLRIMARDQGADPRYSYCTVHVTVSDVNDEPPRFREKHVTTEVSDGAFPFTFNMSAVDLDLNSHLKYSILWNDSYGVFASLDIIRGGDLAQWLDIESEHGMIYQKRVFNSSHLTRFVLTLLVQDVNAPDPNLQQDTAILRINVRETIRTRRSADVSDISNTLHISNKGWKKWDTAVAFSAGLTHFLKVKEAQRVVYNKVFINDGSGYSNTTGTFTCPQSGKYVFEVHTFAPRNSSVWLSLYHQVTRVTTLKVHAGKDSKAESVTAVLQLLQGDEVYVIHNSSFSTSVIEMGTFRTTWTLTIIITIYRVAAGSPTGGAATRTGSLDHVNKLAPEFDTTEMRVSVKEGSPLGQVVVKITAYDRDAGDEGVITYSLHYNQGMFRIDPVSGVVSVASHNIDRETEDTYVLLVQAEDDGGLFSTMTLIITIEDINDNPPIFGQTTYSAILPENEMYFTQPLQLKALDFDNISFSAGHPGEIILTAMAKDHGRVHLNSTAVVIITLVTKYVPCNAITNHIQDTNDNIPQFENDTYHKTVPENISTGSEVVVVHARDSDSSAPNNHVFYFLETGGRDDFAIDHVTGVITVVGKLDRETLANYSLHVMARDQGADPLYSYCTVYINVSDINDEPPRFREKHATTAESDGVFGSIYNMGAVDLDLDARLKYSILWNESYGLSASLTMITGDQLWSWIDIDSENGILLEKRPFDSSHVIRFYLTLLVQDLNAFNPKPQQDTEHQKWEAKISFLAANIHYLEVTNAQRIVYEKILVNEGSGYSNTTGTFTCSQTGKYVFEVHTFAPPNSSVWLALYHQVTRVTTLEVHEGEDSKAESVTAVLQLLQSDEVYVMSTPGHSSRLFGAPDAILNTFSGYLLSPASE